jgi:hypothetical protein
MMIGVGIGGVSIGAIGVGAIGKASSALAARRRGEEADTRARALAHRHGDARVCTAGCWDQRGEKDGAKGDPGGTRKGPSKRAHEREVGGEERGGGG